MARLKLCLMIHYEDDTHWQDPNGSVSAGNVKLLASLATVVGNATGADGLARGAKISMQTDILYLNQNASAPAYSAPSSLRWLFQNNGNLWCHTHSATYNHLSSVHVCVASAFAGEVVTTYAAGEARTAGRSGGPDMSDSSLDWLSITVGAGIYRMNAPTIANYSTMIESLRPYGIDLSGAQGQAYNHSNMPGPLDDAIPGTMRQRPFWMRTSSIWDARIDSIYPDLALVGSVIMIPQPSRISALNEFSGGRTASEAEALTIEDFNAALTNIWTTYQLMNSYQNSITNVWYVHVPPDLITSSYIDTFGAWVDSINAMMVVNTTNDAFGHAVWKNMNEIAELFSNTSSFNY